MARRELVAACALIGAFGGALFAFVMARSDAHAWGLVVGLALSTTLSATLLGLFLARSKCDAIEVGGRAVWGSLVAGAANGAVIVLALWMLGTFPRAELLALPIAAGFGRSARYRSRRRSSSSR